MPTLETLENLKEFAVELYGRSYHPKSITSLSDLR